MKKNFFIGFCTKMFYNIMIYVDKMYKVLLLK